MVENVTIEIGNGGLIHIKIMFYFRPSKIKIVLGIYPWYKYCVDVIFRIGIAHHRKIKISNEIG